MSQKRMIMPYLNEEIKDILRDKDIPQEYKTALSFKPIEKVSPTSYNKIEIDLSKAPEEYIGLDEILYINPQRINSKDIPKLKKVLELCPRVKLGDDMEIGTSTVQEYIEGEEWITSVLDKVNPEWTDLQKLAYIDNAIGKKVSYSPDFDTERFSHADSRILWRIISTGYGVCNRNS